MGVCSAIVYRLHSAGVIVLKVFSGGTLEADLAEVASKLQCVVNLPFGPKRQSLVQQLAEAPALRHLVDCID